MRRLPPRTSAARAFVATSAVAAAFLRCAQPSPAERHVQPAPSTTSTLDDTRCLPIPPEAVATELIGGVCPMFLTRTTNTLTIHPGREEEATITAELPWACQQHPCTFELSRWTHGEPTLILTLPSPAAEIPERVWFGSIVEGQLVLVDLWEGEPTAHDRSSTLFGPVWALAPYDCRFDKRSVIAYFATPRFRGAEHVAPAPGLLAREGLHTPSGAITPIVKAECRTVDIALP